ncbi:MAG: type II toxin-antitoxin system prevent-host-death family antitoxin [Bradymonadales bacterium]|nr:type II toxin-antitoxin system prevent-host-death family antitoxin [Bradymonadales bacterium]
MRNRQGDEEPTSEELVGVRELKNHLSAVLKRVKAGRQVVVTERNRPIAVLIPCDDRGLGTRLDILDGAGIVTWAGGKPAGCRNPPVVKGESVGDAVLEDRR